MFNFGSPIFSYCSFIFIFHILKLLYYYSNNIVPDGLDYYLIDNFVLVILTITTLACYFLYSPLQSHFYRKKLKGNVFKYDEYNINKTVLPLTLFSIFILLLPGMKAGVFPWTDPLSFREIIQGNGGAYLFIIFLFFFKASGCYFAEAYLNKRVTFKDLSYVVIFILFALFSGFGSLFVHFFHAGLIYLSAKFHLKIFSTKVVGLILFVIITAPFYNVIRYTIKGGGEILTSIENFITSNDFDFLWIIANRFDYLDNAMLASKYFRDISDPSYIFSFFYQPIPRFLIENKPLNYTSFATNFFFPENYNIGATNNFGFLGEFILYFGDCGLILGSIFFSVLFIYTLNKYLISLYSTKNSLLYALVINVYFSSFVGGYFNDLPLPTLIGDILLWFTFKRFLLKRVNYPTKSI